MLKKAIFMVQYIIRGDHNNMANDNSKVNKGIDNFFRAAIKYYGKEIGLASNQHFSIDKICDIKKEENGEYRYNIQYGFPQSGCVSMDFIYSKKSNLFTVDAISVYAPPAGENITMANFAPQIQTGEIGISINFGMDMGTQEHKSIQEIEENPNALKMLEIATADLNEAQILGNCMLSVPSGSDRIPCCNSTYISNSKEKSL